LIKTRNLEELQTERDRQHWARALEHIAKDPRIHVINRTTSRDYMSALYRMCDCFVSLHRSEGFGFGPAEAMAHGRPAIVTNYSGVRDFCTEANSKLVSFEIVRVQPDEYPYLDPNRVYCWAEPDVNIAAEYMRELSEDRPKSESMGRAAQTYMLREFSIPALEFKYVSRLRQLGFA
jgi:glycosyltransferase involved in cell wall biosynthesis